jgi:DNA-binding HxlR family transcriptional regulator
MSSVFDREEDLSTCNMAKILPIVTSKWASPIIYYLSFGPLRFSELKRKLPPMADSNFSKVLRSLEQFGMIERHDYQTVPPKVDYSLTDLGRHFIPVMKEMEKFGEYYCKNYER